MSEMPSAAFARRSILRWAFALLWGLDRRSLLTTAGMAVLQSFLPLATVWATARTVDALTHLAMTGPTSAGVKAGILWLAVQGLISGAGQFCSARDRLALLRLQDKTNLTLRLQVLEKCADLRQEETEQAHLHNQLNRFQSGGVEAPFVLYTQIVSTLRSAANLGGFLLILVGQNRAAAGGTLVLLAATVLLDRYLERSEYRISHELSSLERRRSYLWTLQMRPDAGKEIRVFGLGRYLRQQWASAHMSLRLEQLNHALVRDRVALALQILNILVLCAISVGLLFGLARGNLTIGAFIALGAAVTGSQSAVRALSQSSALSLRYLDMSRDLLAFLRIPTRSDSPVTGSPLPAQGDSILECRHLTYCYPGSAKPALRNVTLSVRPGERIAIVGPNGSGKSTLVKCLIGLYTATEGDVWYNGADVRQIHPAELRKHFSGVFQDYTKYALTVRENVAFGNLDRLDDEAAIHSAARLAGLDLSALFPEGLDIPLDRSLNASATDLSIGQWQKLALARALLSDAPVLFLDEPTSALDPLAEAAFYQTVDEATCGRTVLFISHRLGSVQMADRIVVMRSGTIVECGTHADLMAKDGDYAHMYTVQAARYSLYGRG